MILEPYLLKVGLILVYCILAIHQNLTGGMSIEIAAIIQRKLCNTSDANRRGDKFAIEGSRKIFQLECHG